MFKRVNSCPFRTSDSELDHKTDNITYAHDDLIDNDGTLRPILVIPEDSHSFSWLVYSIFVLLGIATLWAWNMFLAAAPYFRSRFAENETILARFQPAITSISCVSGLCTLILLTNLQSKANYPRRIILGLVLVTIVFILLSISAVHFDGVTPEGYFIFSLIMVFFSACATGIFQNGLFALAAGFGRPEYTQAIMTGQGIAGVLPAVSQIFSVLATPESNALNLATDKSPTPDKDSATAAFRCFITATGVSVVALVAVIPLVRKYKKLLAAKIFDTSDSLEDGKRSSSKAVGIWTLYKKLHLLAASIFLCFAISMFYPVFTAKIISVIPESEAPRLLKPATFIPLGFLSWNIGDLIGRLSTLGPFDKFKLGAVSLFSIACLRASFIPLYLLCNIDGRGAMIRSDIFYFLVVSGGFGITNGWLGSMCMMNVGNHVEEGEREAASGFMIANLMAGLTAGSFCSFLVSRVGV